VAVVIVLGCLPPIAQPSRPSMSPSSTEPRAATTPVPTAAPPSDLPSPRSTFIRPTPTPRPTFFAYVVKAGDTLTSIARSHGTTARSIAFWNRTAHPSLDPDAPEYEPDRIEAGWILLLVPDSEVDPEEFTLPAGLTGGGPR
jgi:hypothetical protein